MDKLNKTIHLIAIWGIDLTNMGTLVLQQMQHQFVNSGASRPRHPHSRPPRHSVKQPRTLISDQGVRPKPSPNLLTWMGSKSGRGLLALAGVALLAGSNGKLFLSTGAGVAVMVLAYRLQGWNWRELWRELHQFFPGSNRQLTLAVVSGGIVTLLSYMAISIWTDAESPWIAIALIMQNVGVFGILAILGWQLWHHQTQKPGQDIQQIVSDLTDSHPLKRLMAVRQIQDWVVQHQFTSDPSSVPTQSGEITPLYLGNCLRLMLSQESEPILREAILESLRVLNPSREWEQKPQPVSFPRHPSTPQKLAKIPHFIDS